MKFIIIILMAMLGQQCMPFVSCVISVSDLMVGIKTRKFFKIGLKVTKMRSVFQDRD